MNFSKFLGCLFLGLGITASSLTYGADHPKYPDLRNEKVLLLTGSRSTLDFSKIVIEKTGAAKINAGVDLHKALAEADYVLAIARSNISLPLKKFYPRYIELKRDVNICRNQTAAAGHISVYKIDPDFELIEVFHNKFDWETMQY